MGQIRAWAARHPRAVDACLAGLVAALSVPATAGWATDGMAVGVSGAGWLWFAAVHAPLAWRRRAPVVVCWIVLALVLVGLSGLLGVTGAFHYVILLFAVYTVARHRPWRYLWPVVAAAAGTTVMAPALWGDEPWSALVTGGSALAAATLLGIAARTRRAYLAERQERARQLEREREQQAQLAVAAERARIAREVHDIVAHNLAVMVALADGAAFTMTAAPQRAADTMRKVSATGREALGEMRRLLGLLHDDAPSPSRSAPAPQPGLDDVDALIDQVRVAGVRVALTREGTPGAWGPGAGLAVYRIVQEALTNTLKHAGPQASAQVRLCYTPAGVELEVTDDGAQRPARLPAGDRPAGGHGLAGMIERAAAYGGQVEAGPRPGAGWRVRARLRFGDGEGAA